MVEDIYRAVLDARRAWNDYLDATDEDEDEVYEAYLEAASEAVPLVGGLIELCVEANLVAISARDREERYVDLAATNARVHADRHHRDRRRHRARPFRRVALVRTPRTTGRRRNALQPGARNVSRDEPPNVSRAVDELRQMRDEMLRSGQEAYATRLSHVLNLLQISPPRLSD